MKSAVLVALLMWLCSCEKKDVGLNATIDYNDSTRHLGNHTVWIQDEDSVMARLKTEVEHYKWVLKTQTEECKYMTDAQTKEIEGWKKQVDALVNACEKKDRQIKILSQK